MTLIHCVNDSTTPFLGWLPVFNIDELPLHLRGTHSDQFRYIVGNRSGLDTHNIDVYVGIAPGERRVLDLNEAQPMDYNPHAGMFPQTSGMWGGIPVSVAGVALAFKGAVENGAAFDGHWAGRITTMLHVDLFVHWMPDDPAWCTGEIVIDASNPSVPDVTAETPFLWFKFGDAEVMVPGLDNDAPLMRRGDWLADGQPRILPFVLCWTRHGGNLDMARAVADQKIQARGIKRLHQDGNPHLPPNFDAAKWARDMLPNVIESQHTWLNSPLDPATISGMAGAQGAQSFVGGPAMADQLAVGCFYIGALDVSWPMCHLEADGSPLDWRGHPGLRLFYGKVNVPISADKLGKTAWPTPAESHGHQGPEDEHWFDWVLFAGNRLRGTPATQWHMRMHAIQFLFRYVTEPPGNWLTANRGIGWMCFLAAELYRGLADRELAEAVKARFRDVFLKLIWPLGDRGDWWSWIPYPRNASIGGTAGGPARAIPWQACVLALGLDWAGQVCDDGGARIFAHSIALEILGRIYEKHADGRWHVRDVICYDGSDPGPHFDGYYFFGSPMVVACVLRHEPEHAVAREIWAQLCADRPDYQQMSWLCPSIPVTP